jgi:hypothetical protein
MVCVRRYESWRRPWSRLSRCRRWTAWWRATQKRPRGFARRCAWRHGGVAVYIYMLRRGFAHGQVGALEAENGDLRRELEVRRGEMDDLHARITGTLMARAGGCHVSPDGASVACRQE